MHFGLMENKTRKELEGSKKKLNVAQWRSQLHNFSGAKMFNFRRATIFLFETSLFKA